MHFLARIVDLLTLDRARVYAALTIALGVSIVLSLWIARPERLRSSVDFPAFYTAGRIINEHSGRELYNRELQQSLYREIAPEAAARTNLFFAYAPFFALLFSPLALLAYLPAFVCWALISLALFIVGFWFVWTSATLPPRYFTSALIIALGFLPFYSWCLMIGQTSAFGFFWLSLAIYLDNKKQRFASGCALAVLLYKPTLLLLVIPMVAVTSRWRTLTGFGVGAVVLGMVSLAVIGLSGVPEYLDMLVFFSQAKAAGRHALLFDVDALSFFVALLGARYAWIAMLLLTAIVIPVLVLAWRRDSKTSFALAITWTLLLNFYVVIYDSTLIILAAVLSAGTLARPHLPRGFRSLLLVLFVTPWIARQSAENFAVQPLTIAFVAFGCYQLWTTLGRPVQG